MTKNPNSPTEATGQAELTSAVLLIKMTPSMRDEVRVICSRLQMSGSQFGRLCVHRTLEHLKAGTPLLSPLEPEENLLHAPSMPVEISC